LPADDTGDSDPVTRLKAAIANRHNGDPDLLDLCTRIISELTSGDSDDCLTFEAFQVMVGRLSIDQVLVDAVNLLASPEVGILNPRLMFFDEDGKVFEIDPEAVREARETGIFVHPATGADIFDFESMIVPCFFISDSLTGSPGTDASGDAKQFPTRHMPTAGSPGAAAAY